MKEIANHKIYELLDSIYNRVGIDYIILDIKEELNDKNTLEKIVVESFNILNNRYEENYKVEIDKILKEKIQVEELLELPKDEFIKKTKTKTVSYNIPKPLPYWYAFLYPPYGTNYEVKDFIKFNDILIPNKDNLDIYKLNDDFSNYFDSGKEWWGTGYWIIIDKENKQSIIIAASLTD